MPYLPLIPITEGYAPSSADVEYDLPAAEEIVKKYPTEENKALLERYYQWKRNSNHCQPGWSCIATVTNTYGTPIVSNRDIMNNHDRYGYNIRKDEPDIPDDV